MDYDYNDRKQGSVYSRRLKAGKRRTYFFDVRETRGNDFFLTITESRKRFNEDGYDRHKIFLYKEDFNKFLKALGDAVDHVKTELMPDYDFDSFSHEGEDQEEGRHGTNAYNNYVNTPRPSDDAENTPDINNQQPATSEQKPSAEDTMAVEAEPMEEKTSEPEDVAGPEAADIVNQTATSDKLASEEVEKW